MTLTKQHTGNGYYAFFIQGTAEEIEGQINLLYNHGIISKPEPKELSGENYVYIFVNKFKYISARAGFLAEEIADTIRMHNREQGIKSTSPTYRAQIQKKAYALAKEKIEAIWNTIEQVSILTTKEHNKSAAFQD